MLRYYKPRVAQTELITAFKQWILSDPLRSSRSFDGSSDANRALAYMATGLGKTLGCAMCIDTLMDIDPNKRVLVLTNLGVLHKNMLDTLNAFTQNEHTSWDVNAVKGNRGCSASDNVVVSTVETFCSRANSDWLNGFKPDLVVVDEAHHYIVEQKWGELISGLGVPVLNFTATPFDNMGFPVEGLGEVLVNYPMARCVKDGLLVPTEVSTIRLDNLRNNSAKKLESVLSSSDLITQLIDSTQDNKKVLINGTSISHIDKVAEKLNNSLGSTVACAVHSKLSPDENIKRIADFKAGKYKYLLSYKMLGEGFDCPDVDAVVLLRNLSDRKNPLVRDEIQFIGRGRRLSPGKDTCKVIQLQDTLDRMLSVIPMPSHSEYVMMINDTGEYMPIGDAILSKWKGSDGNPLTWDKALPYLKQNFKGQFVNEEYVADSLRGGVASSDRGSSQNWDRIHNNWKKNLDHVGLVVSLHDAGYAHEGHTKADLIELSYIYKNFTGNARDNLELSYILKHMNTRFSQISGDKFVVDSRRLENRYLLFISSEKKVSVRSITKKEFDHFYSKGGSRLDLSNTMIREITSLFNGATLGINQDIKKFTKDIHKELQTHKELTSNPEFMSSFTEKLVLVAKSTYNNKELSATKKNLVQVMKSHIGEMKPTRLLNELDAIIINKTSVISRIQER